MPVMVAFRRILVLLALAAIGGAVAAWWRDRNATPVPAAAPEWPPFPAPDLSATVAVPSAAEESSGADTAPAGQPDHIAVADIVGAAWRAPDADGGCPDGYPIKVKVASGIFHVPGGRFYDRTKADRCYASADAATADGYRRSKS